MARNIVFMIDVEPDGRKIEAADAWEGTAVTLREVAGLREQLRQKTGAEVRLNWFPRFDPQIEHTWGRRDWVALACPELVAVIAKHRDFAGIHVHMWKWHEGRGDWFNDFADAAWRRECVESSIEGYRSVFGTRPVASRFGDHSLEPGDLAMLGQAGIRYDLTLEPGSPPRKVSDDSISKSGMPDLRRAPRFPYRAAPGDYLTPSAAGEGEDPWLVPLTVTQRSYWVPVRRSPYLMRTPLTMNLVLRPRRVAAHLAWEMERESAAPVVIVVRSGDLANAASLEAFRLVMQRMAAQPAIGRCRFVGVDAAVDAYVQSLKG